MRRNAKTQSATSQTQLTAHFASGRRSGAPRQRKIIWAVAGAVVAIVAAITFFIAALSTFGGGGSGGGSSSGHSQTWQNGYNSGLEQATVIALIESPQVCSAKFLTCEQGSV
jgi:hypothetical protein